MGAFQSCRTPRAPAMRMVERRDARSRRSRALAAIMILGLVFAMAAPALAGDAPDILAGLDPAPEDLPGTDITLWTTTINDVVNTTTDLHDVYAVPLEAGEMFLASITGDLGSDFDMALLDPDAPSIHSSGYWVAGAGTVFYPDTFTYTNTDWDVDIDGDHQLDVFEYNEEAYAYALDYQIISNDTVGPGGPPQVMTGLDGVTTPSTDDDDVFRVSMEVGDRVVSEVWPHDGNDDSDLYLLGPNAVGPRGDIRAASVAPAGLIDRIDHTASQAGTHYLNVFSAGIGGTYTLYHTLLAQEAGSNRFETCAEASRRGWEWETTTDVVIATGYNWPDALGGAAIAGALDCPLLIVEPNGIPSSILSELQALDPDNAIVLGGTGVVGTAVTQKLTSEGILWQRLAGSSRYETAEMAAATAAAAAPWWDGTAFIATGSNFPDALAASPIAAKLAYPIFLEGPSGLSASTLQTMSDIGVTDVVLLGGEGVVSIGTETQMENWLGASHVERLFGTNRYATARAVAEWAVLGGPGMHPGQIAVATGENFPDALSAGPMQARGNGPLYLTAGTSLSHDTALGLSPQSMHCEEIVFMGGTGVISQGTRDAVADLMGGP